MAAETPENPNKPDRPWPVYSMALAVGTLVIIAVAAPHALPAILIDALCAAVILLPACLGGMALVPMLRLGALPMRWHLLLGAVLGVGALSLLVLLLGMAGAMQRPLWLAILAAATVAGVIRCRSLNGIARPTAGNAGAFRYLWILLPPFIALALLAASNPPGFIWGEEGFGYDVLEYHLQLPKEYLAAGSIGYLPHNVYGNFPANVEMLYMLAMIVLDDVFDVGTVANVINLYHAALTVFAAWVAGREWSPRAGTMCGVVAATVGWLPYLCGLAYVEYGMLFFAMAGAAGLVRWFRLRVPLTESTRGPCPMGWAAFVGIAAGFSCGCKYTAVPMIALPIGATLLILGQGHLCKRLSHATVFAALALAAMSPWLIKNQVATGNPVFPLANSWFEASPAGWGDEQTVHWNEGHGLRGEQASLSARLGTTWNHVVNDKYSRFGPALLLLAALAMMRRRLERVDIALVLVAVAQLAVWLFATHLFARFMVVWLVPLTLLAGRNVLASQGTLRRGFAVALLVAGAGWNLSAAARLHGSESVPGAPALAVYEGRLPGFEYFQTVNEELPPNARILVIGDAKAFYFDRDVDYCVVFNGNPFFEQIAEAEVEADVTHWLQTKGYSHILVNWSELRRLAATYGLSPPISVNQIETWFDRSGLTPTHEFHAPNSQARYVDLYAIESSD